MRFEYSDPTAHRPATAGNRSVVIFPPGIRRALGRHRRPRRWGAVALSPGGIHGPRRGRIVRGGRQPAALALVFRPPPAPFLAGRRDGEARAQRERGGG